jgi:hypothetical protein
MVPIARCAWSAQKAEEWFGISDDERLSDVKSALVEQSALPRKISRMPILGF